MTRRYRSLVILISGVTHLLDDMTRPIESHMREKHGKNTVGPNNHKRFQENRDWTLRKYKTILATTSANHPGEGITLRQNHSTRNIHSTRRTRAHSERPPARQEKYTEVPSNNKSTQNFRVFGFIKNSICSLNVRPVNRRDRNFVILISGVTHLFGDMTPPIKGYLREKHRKNTVGPNNHKRFQQNRNWTCGTLRMAKRGARSTLHKLNQNRKFAKKTIKFECKYWKRNSNRDPTWNKNIKESNATKYFKISKIWKFIIVAPPMTPKGLMLSKQFGDNRVWHYQNLKLL